jgi:hypothetical protein
MLLVERQALNEAMEGEKNVIVYVLNFHAWNVPFISFLGIMLFLLSWLWIVLSLFDYWI